jgi:formylglycine-generating enzyme required for sulfatase activity
MRHSFIIALLLSAFPLQAAEQQKLAVLEFEVQRGLSIDRRTFSSLLQNAARNAAPQLFVMTQANIETMLRGAGKSIAECEGECAVDTARLIGADIVISGRISRVGSTMAISMQMYESASGQLLAGQDVKAKTEDGLLDAATDAAGKLLATLARKRSRETKTDIVAKEESIAEQAPQFEAAGAEDVLVKVESEPSGAVAMLDGKLLCQSTPCSKMVSEGRHEFSLQKEGYEDLSEQLEAKKGLVIQRRLARIAATITVVTEPPGLSVSIDGTSAGKAPLAARDFPPGAHEVLIDDPCWRRVGERVVLKKGEERALRLLGKQRLARLKLTAEDEQGNAVEAKATVDGQPLGLVPGTHTVSACAKSVVVEADGKGAEQTLELREGKVTTLQIRLAEPGPKSGETRVEPNSGLRFVPIPGGTFEFQGRQTVSVNPFFLGETATTVDAYARCVAAGHCSAPNAEPVCNWNTDRTDHPINCVDWNQAFTFCRWIGGRLPTEVELEYAASGGSEARTYPWGNDEPGARACWTGEGNDLGKGNRRTTCAVGSYKGGNSKWGVHDLAGNVLVWTTSVYEGSSIVIRGGWFSADDPVDLSARHREGRDPSRRLIGVGLRCAL